MSKRQLGFLALVCGVALFAGVLLYDTLGISDPDGGFGPSQKLGLVGSLGIFLIGLTLLPLGDTPA